MKTFFRLLGIVLIITSCDVIEGDVFENPNTFIPDTSGNDTVQISFAKKLLVEEYTGHKCGNCPGGARLIAELKKRNQYKDKLVAISVHAGGLASWAPAGAPSFTTNFTTPVGDALDDEFGVSLTGIPRGLINRAEFNGSKLILPGSFESAMQDLLFESNTYVAISGSITLNESERKIESSITAHFNEDINEDLRISIYVTEDSVIDWQKNYANTGDPNYPIGDNKDYVHMHVLRGSMNGVWGEALNSSMGAPIENGAKISKGYSYTVNPAYNLKFINVVVFVYGVNNDEIIQVREWHVKDILD